MTQARRKRIAIPNLLIAGGAVLVVVALAGYARLSFRQALLKRSWNPEVRAAAAAEPAPDGRGAGVEAEPAGDPPPTFREGEPVARIRIPRIKLDAVVLQGMSDGTLAVAPGHYPGMALPGESGHAVLAAHRDSFFKELGELQAGDSISVTRWDGREVRYRVARSYIVHKLNRTVIAPRDEEVLTLITCYPFAYAGAAPYRFILEALPAPAGPSA